MIAQAAKLSLSTLHIVDPRESLSELSRSALRVVPPIETATHSPNRSSMSLSSKGNL